MAEMKKVPDIRFKGFNEVWYEKNLSEIATMKARIGWQGLTKKEYLDSGNFYLITGTDFLDGRIDLKNCHYVNEGRYAQDVNIQIKNDDVLITKDGTIGKVAYVDSIDKPATLNAGVFVIRGKDKSICNLYLYQYLAAPYLLDFAYKQATGGTIKHLNQNVLVKFPVPISNVNEQKKIGGYFQNLDKLISLHQTKVNKLTNLKNAMLEKIFPKQGVDVPEVRFKGFAGAWEQKEINALADRYDNLRIPITAANRTPGPVPYYGANGIQDYVDGYTHEGEFILIAEDGANDLKNYPVQYVNGKIWVNNHAHVLQGKNKIASNLFLKFAFSQVNIEPFLVGGGRAKLNAETMMKIEMPVPESIDEQNKIGAYFQNLDKTITLHQAELEKLKNLKKACLEKMFV